MRSVCPSCFLGGSHAAFLPEWVQGSLSLLIMAVTVEESSDGSASTCLGEAAGLPAYVPQGRNACGDGRELDAQEREDPLQVERHAAPVQAVHCRAWVLDPLHEDGVARSADAGGRPRMLVGQGVEPCVRRPLKPHPRPGSPIGKMAAMEAFGQVITAAIRSNRPKVITRQRLGARDNGRDAVYVAISVALRHGDIDISIIRKCHAPRIHQLTASYLRRVHRGVVIAVYDVIIWCHVGRPVDPSKHNPQHPRQKACNEKEGVPTGLLKAVLDPLLPCHKGEKAQTRHNRKRQDANGIAELVRSQQNILSADWE
mmetsp:Transcript_57549/g.168536  ORF Transcript_57549/g.168536 Transcript_57549/m.168536 type:complete len:313 (+) Transcript_57549:281-1219(+)